MKVTLGQRIFVSHEVDKMFESVKARMQGRFFKGPAIYFQAIVDTPPEDSIEGMYHYVLNHLFGAGKRPDETVLANLAEVFGNYVEAQKLKVKNHILADMASAKTKVEALKAVENHIDKSTSYLKLLVGQEAQTVKAYANREGISMVAADMGVADPVVVWFGKVDNKLCQYCKEMYHDENNLFKPRPWRLSQLTDGYFKPKEWSGSNVFHNAHPHCRHTMSYVPPHYGFNNSGRIEFKGFKYDYYNDYHGIKKSEELQPLEPTAFFIDYDEFLKNFDQLHNHKHED